MVCIGSFWQKVIGSSDVVWLLAFDGNNRGMGLSRILLLWFFLG
jgi:hypothetical protein